MKNQMSNSSMSSPASNSSTLAGRLTGVLFLLFILLVILLSSCKNDPELSIGDQQKIAGKAATDNKDIIMTTQESMDITEGALSDQGISDGRAAAGGRFQQTAHSDWDDCGAIIKGSFNINRTNPDSLVYSGSLEIDYGDGSSCSDTTHVKKGKLIDNFTFVFSTKGGFISASQELRFVGFKRGSLLIDGSFIAKAVKGGNTTIEYRDAKITYQDGTSVSWQGNLVSIYSNNNTLIRTDDTRKLAGSISGKTREGLAFNAVITEEILFKYGCPGGKKIPVSGKIALDVGTTSSTIDFGTGVCDKIYTVTTAGTVEQHNL